MRFHNDVGHYVAHYTRLETAVDYILKNRSLRLGPLTATNDPRETKTWLFALGRGSFSSLSSDELKNLAKRNVEFDKLLKHNHKVLCVSQDAEDTWKLDFSKRSYGRPRMWAQYAGNHSGVCLLFDKQALHQAIEKAFGHEAIYFGPVEYGDFSDVRTRGWAEHMEAFMLSGDEIATDGLENVLRRHREKHHRVFFFRKDIDWEHEREYRWIVRGDTNDPVFIPIEDALRAILLGIDSSPGRLTEIHAYCKDTDTCLSRILWMNGIPSVQWFQASDLSAPEYQRVLEFHALIPDVPGG
jgi:hypothetical protein